MVNYVNVVDHQLKEKYPGLYLIKDFKAIVGQYRYNKYKKAGLIEIVEKEKKADVSELVIKILLLYASSQNLLSTILQEILTVSPSFPRLCIDPDKEPSNT